MSARVRDQSGFALVELLAAIVIINVGILAILLSLNSGMVTLQRTAQASTAAAVADRQLERFRAIAFSSVYLDSGSLAGVDAVYTGDSAYSASDTVSQTCSPLVPVCTPSQTVVGPDGRSYRVDTYVVSTTPAGGASVKQVTVVVRKPGDPKVLARVVSTVGEDF
ncbi:MAG TPA: prepilin-type N-terminal cleavage/methylation domain-containing protein [Gaiellaceae bacterium]|nr:prepilin-type N-terminal cleavage/methylation domain-containing protein [Gaiellaceae bacterium]